MASEHRVRAPHVSKPLAKEQTDGEAHAQQLREQGHHDKITELNAVNSPLLRLPAEIRNMIFEQVFVNRVIHLEAYSESPIFIPDIYIYYRLADVGLSLFFASRQLHTETALLPYKLCTMRLLGGCGYQE
ncbi:hypothetical protein AA0115_g12931 [Alternaria tenuissima]|uniref:F-box domain-containing protein n=1 Tax=Alternaria tenuissima TaxID=119927 RepID=A0AB37VWU9_9PLEO|nr:hypothetical protein AA0115_g12931 [Alternaria tenuissima]